MFELTEEKAFTYAVLKESLRMAGDEVSGIPLFEVVNVMREVYSAEELTAINNLLAQYKINA